MVALHWYCRYCIVVTGDHSTPVEFGDHSHEPVPFAIAHVRDVVSEPGCPALTLSSLPLAAALPLRPGSKGALRAEAAEPSSFRLPPSFKRPPAYI